MKKNILLAVCFLMPLATMAQNDTLGHERNITLSEAIVLARTQSVDAAVALNELKTAYWEYRTFRADLLPEQRAGQWSRAIRTKKERMGSR